MVQEILDAGRRSLRRAHAHPVAVVVLVVGLRQPGQRLQLLRAAPSNLDDVRLTRTLLPQLIKTRQRISQTEFLRERVRERLAGRRVDELATLKLRAATSTTRWCAS